MKKHHSYPKKSLGQHFLKDQKIQLKITSDFIDTADAIIEVGPGAGALTKWLVVSCEKRGKPFFVIEKDQLLGESLQNLLKKDQIVIGDALEIDWNEFVKEKKIDSLNGFSKVWLVSNLPYNISAPLFVNFVKSSSIKYLTLMFQKEVGEKIVGKKGMNRLKCLSNPFWEVKVLDHVSRNSFWPKPAVDSIVLSLTKRDTELLAKSEINDYEFFLKELFKFKRKQLLTVFKSFNYNKFNNCNNIDDVKKILDDLQIDYKIRAEDLSMEQIINLYLSVNKL
ncbi:MAG: ribosomal RNA small subunit methyltransferase A [Oligoflexia bacterium]|nr:ribosomal RNA small subunit methyltransferase A [Oligoflexia bacterium]